MPPLPAHAARLLDPPLADPFVARFLARVPADVRASFSRAQLAAVRFAFGMRYAGGHWLDWRRSVRLPFGRVYIVVMIGRDRA